MKKILSLLLLCTTTLISCQEPETDTSIPVSGITLNKTELSLIKDGKETLNATVAPENTPDKSVTWESSDTSVATVSENGEVTAVKEGTAVITVTSVADNTQKATCKVTVATSPNEVTLNKTELSLLIGAKETLNATITPEGASDKSVTWESSDTNVATVSANGEVTALTKGTATITVTMVDGKKTASCVVTVTLPPTEITLNKTNLLLLIGVKETLQVTITPESAPDKSVTWESSDTDVATVSENGEVTALTKGAATITITLVDGKKTASCVVTVVDETTARCQVVNNATPVTSTVGANGTMYEANVIFYGDPTEIGVASVGNVSPSGGQSSMVLSLAGATRARVSFKLSPTSGIEYTVDYFALTANALTTISITDDTMLTRTKGVTKGATETMTLREALSRL